MALENERLILALAGLVRVWLLLDRFSSRARRSRRRATKACLSRKLGGRRQTAQSPFLREYAALFQVSKRMKMASKSLIVTVTSP